MDPAGHRAITAQAVKQLFESRADAHGLIDGMTEHQYFVALDIAQAHQDRFYGPTWHPAWAHGSAQTEHSMADPHASGLQNLANNRDYIEQEFYIAKHEGTMAHLGGAVHAVEDSYSEGHAWRGPSANSGDPTAPIESLNVYNPFPSLHQGTWGILGTSGTHDSRFEDVPVGPNGELLRGTDIAAANASALLLVTFHDNFHKSDATALDAIHSQMDRFYHPSAVGVKVNDVFTDSWAHERDQRLAVHVHELQLLDHKPGEPITIGEVKIIGHPDPGPSPQPQDARPVHGDSKPVPDVKPDAGSVHIGIYPDVKPAAILHVNSPFELRQVDRDGKPIPVVKPEDLPRMDSHFHRIPHDVKPDAGPNAALHPDASAAPPAAHPHGGAQHPVVHADINVPVSGHGGAGQHISHQQQAWLDAAIPMAQATQRESGVPASVTLAQAINESAWGSKHIDIAKNYFGIKAHSHHGKLDIGSIAIGSVRRPTHEEIDGKLVPVMADFRVYRSMEDSFRDHAKYLRENPLYKEAFHHTDDGILFARAIAGHYATASNYAQVLTDLIHQFHLQDYDHSGDSHQAAPDAEPPAHDGRPLGADGRPTPDVKPNAGSPAHDDAKPVPLTEAATNALGDAKPVPPTEAAPHDRLVQPGQDAAAQRSLDHPGGHAADHPAQGDHRGGHAEQARQHGHGGGHHEPDGRHGHGGGHHEPDGHGGHNEHGGHHDPEGGHPEHATHEDRPGQDGQEGGQAAPGGHDGHAGQNGHAAPAGHGGHTGHAEPHGHGGGASVQPQSGGTHYGFAPDQQVDVHQAGASHHGFAPDQQVDIHQGGASQHSHGLDQNPAPHTGPDAHRSLAPDQQADPAHQADLHSVHDAGKAVLHHQYDSSLSAAASGHQAGEQVAHAAEALAEQLAAQAHAQTVAAAAHDAAQAASQLNLDLH